MAKYKFICIFIFQCNINPLVLNNGPYDGNGLSKGIQIPDTDLNINSRIKGVFIIIKGKDAVIIDHIPIPGHQLGTVPVIETNGNWWA